MFRVMSRQYVSRNLDRQQTTSMFYLPTVCCWSPWARCAAAVVQEECKLSVGQLTASRKLLPDLL